MQIPPKLNSDLRKASDEQRDAFLRFVEAMETRFPQVRIQSQQRYSAFYLSGRIIAYIEPQKLAIKLGFFRNYLPPLDMQKNIALTGFASWNKSKGGLVGFLIDGVCQEPNQKLAIARRLIFYTIERMQERL